MDRSGSSRAMVCAASATPIASSVTSWPRSRTSRAEIFSAPSSWSANTILRCCWLPLRVVLTGRPPFVFTTGPYRAVPCPSIRPIRPPDRHRARRAGGAPWAALPAPPAPHPPRRYQRPDEPFDDLFQVACLGLVKAIDRFDLEREVAFSSYAVPTILGEIKRHFRDRTWSVRVPRDLQELALRVDKKVAQLSTDLRRQPTVSEIAEATGATEEEVLEALEASGAYRATSLETPRGGEAEDGATLAQLLRAVTPREREVLRLRFEYDLTQAEIGERIGVSQMQVSRIIRQSIARLRSVARTGEEGPA